MTTMMVIPSNWKEVTNVLDIPVPFQDKATMSLIAKNIEKMVTDSAGPLTKPLLLADKVKKCRLFYDEESGVYNIYCTQARAISGRALLQLHKDSVQFTTQILVHLLSGRSSALDWPCAQVSWTRKPITETSDTYRVGLLSHLEQVDVSEIKPVIEMDTTHSDLVDVDNLDPRFDIDKDMHPKDKGQLSKYGTLAYKLLGDYTPRNLILSCSLVQAKPRIYRLRCRGFQTLRKHDMTLFFDIGPSSVLDVWADMENRTLNVDFYSKFEPLRKIWIRTLLHSTPTSALTPSELLLPPAYTRGIAPPGSGTGVLGQAQGQGSSLDLDTRTRYSNDDDDSVYHRNKRLRRDNNTGSDTDETNAAEAEYEEKEKETIPNVSFEIKTGLAGKSKSNDDDGKVAPTRQYNHPMVSATSSTRSDMDVSTQPPFVPWDLAKRDLTTTTAAAKSIGLKHKPRIIPRIRPLASVAIGVTGMETDYRQHLGRKRVREE